MNNKTDELYQQWQLSNLRELSHQANTDNKIFIAYSDQYKKDVVLKIGQKKLIDQEIKALQYFQGDGCVKLLQVDQKTSEDYSAFLLEFIQPGRTLKDLFLQGQEEESIDIFVSAFKEIHKNSDKIFSEDFQTIEQRLKFLHRFISNNDRLTQLLPQAVQLAHQIVATQGKQYLLHGDLHHENILQSDNSWVIIDPQGVIGELEYEVGAFIRNPLFTLLEHNSVESLLLYRFERLSHLLNLDKKRIIDWSFVQAVLAACYCEQDRQNKGANYFIAVAELIAKVTDINFRLNVSVKLVTQLIAEQFQQWAHLPIKPVAVSGWDNRTFHLGDEMSVRLPSAQEYAMQVAVTDRAKEKAKDLYKQFLDIGLIVGNEAKQCALIAVDELIVECWNIREIDLEKSCDYWKEVKQEIELL